MVAVLPERLRLDLADPLTGDLEGLAHLLEGMVGTAAYPEAHSDGCPFFAPIHQDIAAVAPRRGQACIVRCR